MSGQAADLSRRFARLAPDKRRVFLDALAARGIDFLRLPIVAGDEDAGGERVAPLSYAQERLWLIGRMGGDAALLHIAGGLALSGALDRDALARALDALVARHPALRTGFRAGETDEVEAVTASFVAASLREVSLEAEDRALAEERLASLSREEARRPFDLAAPPLFRAVLVRMEAERHVLLLTMHHLVSDGRSVEILLADLMRLYAAGESSGLPPLPIAYADYARWQRDWLEAGELERQLGWWRDRLGATESVIPLPADRPRPAVQSFRGAAVDFAVDADIAARLESLARQAGATTAMVLLAILSLVLRRYTGEADLRIGVPVANRNRPETEALVGLFVNTLAIRVVVDPAASVLDHVRAVRDAMVDAQGHQDLPFERLVEALQTRRTVSHTPVVQVMHSHRVEGPSRFNVGDLVVSPFGRGTGNVQFDLVLETVAEAGGALRGAFGYARDLFQRDTMERMRDGFLTLLRGAVEETGRRVDTLPLVPAASLASLSSPYADGMPLSEALVPALIGAAAQADPDAPAVICGPRTTTFGELDRAANRLAHRLIRDGIGPEAVVAVALPRGPDQIAAFLAILRAGGAFLPLDPAQPRARLAALLRDAGARLLLVQGSALDGLAQEAGMGEASSLDPSALDLASEPETAPSPAAHPGQLAYVIYTSGSTGTPKGVAVAHGPLARHVRATGAVYGTNRQTRELHVLSMSFDGAQERWMVPLAFGGCVVLKPDGLWTPREALDAMERHGVTHAGFPTAYMHQLALEAASGPRPSRRSYAFGGEALSRESFALIGRALDPTLLINGYGPTETVISPLVWRARAGDAVEGAYAPIGRAVGDRRAYILDAALQPVPVGVTGELHLGGDGLARGYLGRAGQTADRFIPDPFPDLSGREGGRLYRTGDLARWRADGTVEYLGRADAQVKLRGFRIELGEVEAALLAQEIVAGAAAALRQGPAGPLLVAYVVTAAGAELDASALRADLARRLPDYMVPSRIVALDRLPLTPNGKLDRAALPEPAPLVEATGGPSRPLTPTETVVAEIWAKALGLPAIPPDRNFFEAGANSLTALRVLTALGAAFPERSPTIADIFNNQSVETLAAALTADAVGTAQVVRLRATGDRPMLYCFPGLMVNTREYAPLVRRLGPDQPVTGFVCYSLTDARKSVVSVEDIAARYAEIIEKESAGRPCTMLGWSWGGVLAYEAARMLGSRIDLSFVGMLDVCDIDVSFAVGALPVLTPEQRRRLQENVASWLERSPMRADWEDLFRRMDPELHEQFLAYVAAAPDPLPLDGPGVGSKEYELWTFVDNTLLYRRYRADRFDCPIRVWLAGKSVERGLNHVDWGRYSNRVEQVTVIPDVTHREIVDSTMFHDSFAASL
ncbi:amino acid adenylation domain-containing protein [Methylobacterium bullatum]|uniref:D-alanine--D-alanyl carrier protein ligase n=1 Tax=Methylobacterium bullatum TaxID=570505 RepID=A0AAV4Z867_9HYPH|nr:amino acid adenylation domain-containing protein [Methylobacterium bullatum]GJD40147.1 D-alanine--D-alanyl carrier protein ligase [Methylobacterium bullatum]